MPKQPQDRMPKATAPKFYTFTAKVKGDDGKVKTVTHQLPLAEDAVPHLEGRALRDATLAGDAGELRLGFQMLEACQAKPEAVDALYSLPAPEMLEHIAGWMNFKPSEEDASLGESDSSSS